MIRFLELELLHWDVQPHQRLPFAGGVTLLTGENGSGKTSVMDAIKAVMGSGERLQGGGRGGSERTITGYLQRQSRAEAMIRLVADNAPEPGTRRRPFDPLGAFARDRVTLAVVFRAYEEEVYRKDYYLLDGDVVPLTDHAAKALPSLGAYRDRLRKVGITERYVRLLCLPQGQIASFCQHPGERLFDDLFDIIGGRDALETWQERIRELEEEKREHGQVEVELAKARKDLEALRLRARSYEEYAALTRELETLRRAVPYASRDEARQEVQRLEGEVLAAEAAQSEGRRELERAHAQADEARRLEVEASARAEERGEALKALRARRDERVQERADGRAERRELDKLREAAEGVTPRDPEVLEAEAHQLRTRRAAGEAEHGQRGLRRDEIERRLEVLDRGLVPMPEGVDAFRDALRNAGIPHHLLAEVVDVEDPQWQEAVEGWLGRHRFAVLVQDPLAWPRAAELAREHRYPHGVLAPDYKGRSPRDEESPAAFLTVREKTYRWLVHRLVRRLRPEEPPEPLEPPRDRDYLAPDGFFVGRMEARHVAAETLYLGQEARRRQKLDLERERDGLDEADGAWAEAERELRRQIGVVEQELERQRRRLRWESARERHAELAETLERLDGDVRVLDERIEAADKAREKEGRAAREMGERAAGAEQRAATAEMEIGKARDVLEVLVPRLADARDALGRLMAEVPGEIPAEVADVLREHAGSSQVLKALLRVEEARLESDFEEADRDPNLPRHYERQEHEVAAVEERLHALAERLDDTRRAAEEAHEAYKATTRRVFRSYFRLLEEQAHALDFEVQGTLAERDDGRFRCDVRVSVGDKTPVHHDSEELSGGQKAALSILMAMTAVSLERDSAGFFLVDEPFSQSDVVKINELGEFLARTGAQYLLSMPTSADLQQCGSWLDGVWHCTRSRGGIDEEGNPILAPRVRPMLRRRDADG